LRKRTETELARRQAIKEGREAQAQEQAQQAQPPEPSRQIKVKLGKRGPQGQRRTADNRMLRPEWRELEFEHLATYWRDHRKPNDTGEHIDCEFMWTGQCSRQNAARKQFRGREYGVQQLFYMSSHREVTHDIKVTATCQNRLCLTLAHLQLKGAAEASSMPVPAPGNVPAPSMRASPSFTPRQWADMSPALFAFYTTAQDC
jgi:hypothetical protein